jgi:hypothetical protein
MRFGLILCEKPCVGGEMDYDFEGSMMSVTGGPSLDPAWGDGYFDEDGYHFDEGNGMEVETQRCLMNNTISSVYTVHIELSLDKTDRPQMLMSSDGWDQGGIVVDGWLQLAPSGANMVCEEQHLKPGRDYKITMTRTASGIITLYLNGAECATGDPPFFNDYRLKKDVTTTIIPALDRVNRLRPVNYAFKYDSIPREGFIAHEVQEVIPSAVSYNKDDIASDGKIQPQSLNIAPLVAVLTKAIQELSTEVSALRKELDAVKSKLP